MATIRSLLTRWLFAGAAARAAADVPLEAASGEIPSDEPRHPSVRFEPKDVNTRNVLYTAAGVLIGMGLITLSVLPMYKYFEVMRERDSEKLPSSAGVSQVPPEPRLQQDPRRDLQVFRTHEELFLQGYGWVDRAHGVVSIPISRAMELVAQRGIPPKPAPPGNLYFNPHEGSRLTGFDEKVEPEPR